jgi:hypothetical protein
MNIFFLHMKHVECVLLFDYQFGINGRIFICLFRLEVILFSYSLIYVSSSEVVLHVYIMKVRCMVYHPSE